MRFKSEIIFVKGDCNMIFIDSTYFIGLMLKNDDYNDLAKNVTVPNEKRVINNLVLSEVLNIISKRSKLDICSIYKIISNKVEIVYLDENDYLEAIKLCKYYNNSINYSDCLILVTMKKLNINKIVSFDSGFKKVKGLDIIR